MIAARATRRPRLGLAIVAVALATAVVPRLDDVAHVRAAQAHQWSLQRDLEDAVAAAGGRDAVLRCGTPFVGRFRGPLLAYTLDVRKRDVEPDDPPHAPGIAFRAPITEHAAPEPAVPASFAAVTRAGLREVRATCGA